jgi:hypothetical protein
MKEQADVVVIGGGAAGFFSALSVKQHHPEYSVIILEKSSKVLSKVKVSGGGRCNVTHSCFNNRDLIENYPRGSKFLRNGFAQFNPSDTIEWFKKRGVKLKTEEDGRMFPTTDSSQTIIDCFLEECQISGIDIQLKSNVQEINYTPLNIEIKLDQGLIHSKYLIIAAGGHPKIENYNWLQGLGLKINRPLPSLFTFNMPEEKITQLMGLSVPNAEVKVEGHKRTTNGPLLITHWGMSGPAILKLSAWGAQVLNEVNYQFNIQVKWLQTEVKAKLENYKIEHAQKSILTLNPFDLPKRLWAYFIEKAQINKSKRWTELSKKETNKLVEILNNDKYQIKGKTTFKEEFVTCGGIDLKQINAKTMEAKELEGVYFCGEILDIDGYTGGFNFQAAWTTGFISGMLSK